MVMVVAACGPSVAVSSGTDGDAESGGASSSGGVTDPGSSSEGPTATDDSTSGTPGGADSSGAASSSSGGEAELDWCWSGVWTDAPGLGGLWTDGASILAAGGTSILGFDGNAWSQRPLEGDFPTVSHVAARAVDDAWFAPSTGSAVVRLLGERLSTVELPLESAAVLSLRIEDDGELWALLRPDAKCGIGPCEDEDPVLYRFDGEAWAQHPDSAWIETFDVVGDTVWAAGSGQVGSTAGLSAWVFVDDAGQAPSGTVRAVSGSEFWVADFLGSYWHWDAGVWTAGSVAPEHVRSVQVDEDGTAWFLTRTPGDDVARLERVDDGGRILIAEVPDAYSLALTPDGDALVGQWGRGYVLHRVSDVGGAATVSLAYAQEDIGGFSEIFAPGPGDAVGLALSALFGSGGGLQRHDAGAWTTMQASSDVVRSVWGPSTDDLWTVDSLGALTRLAEGEAVSPALPLDDPRLARVWGNTSDDLYVCGAPAVNSGGVANELMVMHWDGVTWTDVSPEDVTNIGGRQYLDMHGVGDDLYVKTAYRVYHYDGATWTNTFSPDPDIELSSVRAFSSTVVLAIDEQGTLLVFDGDVWDLAANVWPELAGLTGELVLTGNDEAGLYLTVRDPSGEAPDALWTFAGEGWEPVALPEGIGHTAVFGVAEDGSELWGDDGRRIWHAVRCAR